MTEAITFFAEDTPGPKWSAGARAYWPQLRRWLLPEGSPATLPTAAEGRAALAEHMPELLPAYDRLHLLVEELVPGDDTALRLLTHWCPPPIFSGCSIATLPAPSPLMLRNYDFDPLAFEGRVWLSRLTGRAVLASSEGLWGVLDGLNDAGLAVGLTFGGGTAAGRGFSTPLALRYLLETCTTVGEARAALERLPAALVQNVVLLDRSGESLVAYLHPERPARFEAVRQTTNHQPGAEPPPEHDPVRSCERLELLRTQRPEPALFLRPPLYATQPDFRTLYSVAYAPAEGRVRFFWPERALEQSFERFTETEIALPALG